MRDGDLVAWCTVVAVTAAVLSETAAPTVGGPATCAWADWSSISATGRRTVVAAKRADTNRA